MSAGTHRTESIVYGTALALSLVAALAEGVIWWLSAAGTLPLALALGLHGLVSGGLAFAAIVGARERSALVLLAAGTFFMGPFGAAGSVAMAAFASLSRGADFESYRRALGPSQEDDLKATPVHRPTSRRALVSFNDVMRWGTRREKQAALRLMAERYGPAFAGAFRLALRDPAVEIRSEAGAAANAILNTMETRAKKLAERAAKGDARVMAAYGDAELAIARSGLAGEDRMAAARASALRVYEAVLAAEPKRNAVRLKAAQAQLENHDYREAARQSARCLAEGDRTDDMAADAFSVHLESLFALGAFAEIRKRAAMAPPQGRTRRAIALWTRPQRVRNHA